MPPTFHANHDMSTIEAILGVSLTGDPLNSHKQISEGLDPAVLHSLAEALGIPKKPLIEWATGKVSLPRKGKLSSDASDLAYRLATCLSMLKAKGLSPQQASLWMRNHQPSLKNEIPILLLKSYHGFTYVEVAIERM